MALKPTDRVAAAMRVLYQYQTCPYSGKARRRLRQLGLAFDRVDVPRDDRTVLRSLGSETVPVLDDGGTVHKESADICRYLDATYGTPHA